MNPRASLQFVRLVILAMLPVAVALPMATPADQRTGNRTCGRRRRPHAGVSTGAWMLHPGSTGCESPSRTSAPGTPCAPPNRVSVTVDDVDARLSTDTFATSRSGFDEIAFHNPGLYNVHGAGGRLIGDPWPSGQPAVANRRQAVPLEAGRVAGAARAAVRPDRSATRPASVAACRFLLALVALLRARDALRPSDDPASCPNVFPTAFS